MRRLSAVFFALLAWMPSIHSTRTISDVMTSVVYAEGESGHCTAFAVAPEHWLTQEHCLEFGAVKINGHETHILKRDHSAGLILLQGPSGVPLRVAKTEPALGDAVTLFGWPLDWGGQHPLVFFGHLQASDVKVQIEDEPMFVLNLYHEGGGPGMSGGPIVNSAGDVVGVIYGSALYPSVSVASQTVTTIRQFLGLK